MENSYKVTELPKSPIFIVGYPRSGTTLLRALLGAHSKIHLINEPEIMRGIKSLGVEFSDRIHHKDFPHLLNKLRDMRVCGQYISKLSAERLNEQVEIKESLSFKEVYEFLLPKPDNIEIWGEKSLGNIFYISDLYKLYPGAIFIHILRDPRAALLSHYRKKFANSEDCDPVFNRAGIRFFIQGSIRWKYWLEAVKDAQKILPKSSFIQILFSDLVTYPEQELRRICSKIKIDFEPEMLDVSRRKNDPVVSSSGAYAHQNLNKSIDSSRAQSDVELPAWASYIVKKYLLNNLSDLKLLSFEETPFYEKCRIELETLIAENKIKSRLSKNINNRNGYSKQVK
ncbi:MAG: sulfotransferase [Acidobacteriota bacterium]